MSQNQSQVFVSLLNSCCNFPSAHHFNEFFAFLLLLQYALRSVYPASYTHIGQEFGAAVSMDVVGALFVGAPNQLSSSSVETQNGVVHVLQLHSSPSESASQPSTAINSLHPLKKPIGTSCASLLQQVYSTFILRTTLSRSPPSVTFSHIFLSHRGIPCQVSISSSPHHIPARPFQFTATCSLKEAGGACVTQTMATAMLTCLATILTLP